MEKKRKPRIAFFDFACCEGCQLTVLQMEESLFRMLDQVEVAAWREVMTGESDDYDVAFCEGSICRRSDLKRLEKIRENAKIVAALGSCAALECHNALRNHWTAGQLSEMVYGNEVQAPDLIPAIPVSKAVRVDYQVLGCPASLPEFKEVFTRILKESPYRQPNEPVCVECKRNDYLCVCEKGMFCLGPLTRCGCDAACTAYGEPCRGCRGLIEDANLDAVAKVVEREDHHSIMAEVAANCQGGAKRIYEAVGLFNGPIGRPKQ